MGKTGWLFFISADSVISISSRSGGSPDRERALWTLAARSDSSNWSGEQLTATRIGVCRAAMSAQALCNTLDDHAGLLGHRNEVQRRDHSVLRPDPANEGFIADGLLFPEADDRLVEKPKLFVVDRPPEPVFDVGALMHCARHAGVVEAEAALVVGFRRVEREIRRLEEFAGRVGVLGRRADADARADHDLGVADFKRF